MAEYREDIEDISETGTHLEFSRALPRFYQRKVVVPASTPANGVIPLFQADAFAILYSFNYMSTEIAGGSNFTLGLYNYKDISVEVKKDALATGIDLSAAVGEYTSLMPKLVTAGAWGIPFKKIPAVVTALGNNLDSTNNFWVCLVAVAKPSAEGSIYIDASWVNGKI